jgi:hypothetical protein
MDWLPQIFTLAGVGFGAGLGFLQTRYAMDRKLAEDRLTRDEAERTAVVAALATSLSGLLDQAASIPEDTVHQLDRFDRDVFDKLRAAESAWDRQWQPLVRIARMAALEVRDDELRGRLVTSLRHLADWEMLDHAFHGKARSWVLRGVVDEMVESVFAWRRGQPLPSATPRIDALSAAWELKQDEFREREPAVSGTST